MLAPSTIAHTVIEDETPDVLQSVSSPGCAVAVWQRSLAFQDWIDGLESERLPEARLELRAHEVEEELQAVWAERRVADCPNRRMLTNDVARLTRSFARIMGCVRLRLRLDVLSDDACTRFHLDNVSARLLCTYRGRGTEYGRAREGEDPHPIHRLATGSAGIFRGRLWPGPERSGVVHRSPRIAGFGETRLLLVIDPPEQDG